MKSVLVSILLRIIRSLNELFFCMIDRFLVVMTYLHVPGSLLDVLIRCGVHLLLGMQARADPEFFISGGKTYIELCHRKNNNNFLEVDRGCPHWGASALGSNHPPTRGKPHQKAHGPWVGPGSARPWIIWVGPSLNF